MEWLDLFVWKCQWAAICYSQKAIHVCVFILFQIVEIKWCAWYGITCCYWFLLIILGRQTNKQTRNQTTNFKINHIDRLKWCICFSFWSILKHHFPHYACNMMHTTFDWHSTFMKRACSTCFFVRHCAVKCCFFFCLTHAKQKWYSFIVVFKTLNHARVRQII